MLKMVTMVAILVAVGGRSVQNNAADNIIKKEEVPPRQVPLLRRFVNLTRKPPASVLSASAGDVVELTCEAIGAPAPTVHWYKNDEPVSKPHVKSSEVLEPSPWSIGRMTSTFLVMRAHHDRYTCVAVAGVKMTQATTLVYIKDSKSNRDLPKRGRLTPLAPRILVIYETYMDVSGSTVTLPCKARGHPRPRITWTDNQGQLIKPHTNARIKVLRSGELMISDLRWSDMGEYSCQASNANGSQSAKTFIYPAKAG